MSAYVLDTHSLIFYATDRLAKLGKAARRIFDKYEAGEVSLLVPAPVIIETWQLALNGTIQPETTLDAWWDAVSTPMLVHVELTAEDVLRAANLEWSHKDIFDRLIVATALRLELPLLTRDGAITDWGGVEVVW